MRNQRGATLITVLVIGVVSLVFMAGIYYLLTRSLQVSGSVPVYLSLRDAAASGAHYAASQIQKGTIIIDRLYDCISNPIVLKFKLKDSGATFENTVTVCLIGYSPPPGFKEQGVGYSKVIPGRKGYIYLIDSIAVGPNNTYTKVEAAYTP